MLTQVCVNVTMNIISDIWTCLELLYMMWSCLPKPHQRTVQAVRKTQAQNGVIDRLSTSLIGRHSMNILIYLISVVFPQVRMMRILK